MVKLPTEKPAAILAKKLVVFTTEVVPGLHLNGTCETCVATTTTPPVSPGSCEVVGFQADARHLTGFFVEQNREVDFLV